MPGVYTGIRINLNISLRNRKSRIINHRLNFLIKKLFWKILISRSKLPKELGGF